MAPPIACFQYCPLDAQSLEGDDAAAACDFVEPTGSDTLIQGKVSGEKVTALLHQRLQVHPGDKLRLTTLPENIHLFDTHTQRRLGE